MKTEKVSAHLLAKYYNEIEKILVYESDESLAEIYCQMNKYEIPEKLKGVTVYAGLENTIGLPSAYFAVFSDIMEKILPEQTRHKIHIRNLHNRSNWEYGGTYIHFMDAKKKELYVSESE